MADSLLSGLAALPTPIAAGDLLYVDRGGVDYKATGADIPGGGDLLAANNLSDVASAATSRTNLGVGTGDSPQFAALNIGHATNTTITQVSAGVIAVEGVTIYAQGGALGTPASGVATNLTGTAAGLTAGVASAVAVGGITGLGVNVATALAVNIGSAGAPVLFNGAGGTPTSLVGTNITGTAAGLTAGAASAVAVGGITGLGTNVATALAVNVGSAGAFVTFNGAGGTPSSLTGTNITGTAAGLTAGVASAVAVGGITGLGTNVATALAVNVGSAGAVVTFNGAGGTPSSMTGTNITGTAAGLTAGVASAVAVGGITGLGTGVATALAVNVGSAGAPVVNGGALGTPSSGTLTNATGLPPAGQTTAGRTFVIGFGKDGGGSALTTSTIASAWTAPVGYTIVGYNLSADAGTFTVKFWKIANGTAIPTIADVINTSGVALSSGTHVRSSTTSDFTTTTITAGDIIMCAITAIATATWITVELEVTKS